MTPRDLIVAIDGPSGAGKGTVARQVAERLGYRHVDTGAMYRAVAWKALQGGVTLEDEARVAGVAQDAVFELGGGRTVIDGHDVTQAIRTSEMDHSAARVARLPAVRAALVARQRAMGESGGVVMEGRDIGTVVFPDADVKIFLDADPEERARRRAVDPAHAAASRSIADVASALATRDQSDRTRTVSPLAAAAGATMIDTTGMGIEEVVTQVLRLVEEKRRGTGV